MQIEMPANGWRPRPNQQPLWDYFCDPVTKQFDGTNKRAIEIAHRRWGKDDVALHLTAKASATRIAGYWHMLPQADQARKAIWTAVNPHTGKRRIDEAFPREWRATTLENEMFIRFKWGSTWQVLGSDNFQSLVGTPPAGLVYSEFAKAHPGAWAYLSPILVENKGWAMAITTPEGRNHAHSLYEMAKKSPGWFADLQTVEDSIRICNEAGFKPPMSLADVEAQRKEYHAIYGPEAGDALIQQEFWCSWSAAILGAFWGKEIEAAEREGRICDLDVVKHRPVHRAWDIGIDDAMAIWCFQVFPGAIHVVDYIEGSGYDFGFYKQQLGDRGYLNDKRGVDHVPHDARQRVAGSGGGENLPRTRIQTMFSIKLNPELVPDHKPMDRVNAGRRILPRCWFDEQRCSRGLESLRSYKSEWNAVNRVFSRQIAHNWASHGGDAFGHMAVSVEFPNMKPAEKEKFTGIKVKPLTVNDLLKSTKPDRKWA
jgi:phage terminase large subunit